MNWLPAPVEAFINRHPWLALVILFVVGVLITPLFFLMDQGPILLYERF